MAESIYVYDLCEKCKKKITKCKKCNLPMFITEEWDKESITHAKNGGDTEWTG